MREYIRKHTATGPFASEDPVGKIADFLVENGYELVGSARGARPEELEVKSSDFADGEDSSDAAEVDAVGEPDASDAEGGADDYVADDDAADDDMADEADEDEDDSDKDDADKDDDAAHSTGDHDPNASSADEDLHGARGSDDQEVLVQASLERGKKGAGLRSSNMTDLYSHVSVKLRGSQVLLDYLVDISWQVLNEEDERFWTREAESAIKYAEGRGHLRDFRPSEEERAKETRGDFTMMGTWLAIIVFFLIFAFFLTMR